MNFLRNSRGDASNASIFVFILALILAIYFLLIPSDVVFENTGSVSLSDRSSGASSSDTTNSRILLREFPGTLVEQGVEDFDYDLSSVTVFEETHSRELATENPFIVENGWFVKKSKTIEFETDDNTAGIFLSFNVVEHDGILQVKVNDQVVFEGEIEQFNAQPIPIKERYLQEVNTLELSVNSVGLAFWDLNTYHIQDFKIFGDVKDISRQESITSFFLPSEHSRVDQTELEFIPECVQTEVGVLSVGVNGNRIFEGVPECGRLNQFEFKPSFLQAGQNEISFKTTDGTYVITLLQVETSLADPDFPTYYFFIDDDQWDDIRDGDYIANFSLEFAPPERHYIDMKVNVNNREFGVYTRNETWFKVLDEFLREDNNFIRLVVEEDSADIVEAKLEIERVKRSSSSIR